MVLNFGQSLFGNGVDFTNPAENHFTKGQSFKVQSILALGVAGQITMDAYGGTLKEVINELGVEVGVDILNMSGAARTISIIVTNLTKGTTLKSGGLVIGGTTSASYNFFFPPEQVELRDTLRLAIGLDGIGTAAGASVHGYVSFMMNKLAYEKI